MRFNTLSILSVPLLAACAAGTRAPAAAAPAQSAAFVVRLGSDTVAVEQFTRAPGRVEGDLMQRSPVTRIAHYVLALDAEGRPTRLDYTVRRPDGAPVPTLPRSVAVTFGDTTRQTVTFADSTATIVVATPGGAFPLLSNSFAMYETVLTSLRTTRRDSATVPILGVGSKSTVDFPMVFRGDSAHVGWFEGLPLAFRTDAAGRVLGVNASGTTEKVLVERVDRVDLPTLAAMFAAREAQGAGIPQISGRDTVTATLGAAHLWVDYGRPHKRGRTIFGNVVPWNQVWRTGANAATQFKTDRDLQMNGVTVPAGMYTLWTLPSQSGWQLIVNKETGQWGTRYKPAEDLVRIPLRSTTLAAPIEEFTIAFQPSAGGGTMTMAWDTTQLTMPIVVK